MVTLSRKTKAVIVIALVFFIATAAALSVFVSLNASSQRRYYVDPASAVHITANGDITSPYGSTPIPRNGDTYTLTSDLLQWLIIEKSNIVLDGNGFTVGQQRGLSLSSVKNVTVKDLTVKASFTCLSLQHVQNCTLLRVNTPTAASLFLIPITT